jgi:hypothetical protein
MRAVGMRLDQHGVGLHRRRRQPLMFEVAAHHDVGAGERIVLAHSDVLAERSIARVSAKSNVARPIARGLGIDRRR